MPQRSHLSTTHETLSRADGLAPGSARSFGFVFAGALGAIGALGLWRGSGHALYFLGAAAAFALSALWAPRLLQPLNKLWFRFGLLLNAVVGPLVMGLIFYLTITPIAWLMRATGKRPLSLAFDRDASSYWIHRDPPGPAPDSLPRQF
jgi:hypothetical protein